jgi:DNA repair exonuclease SbcCD nuclease subunit
VSARSPLRLVHTSDVHLGGWSDEGRRTLIEQAFRGVVDLALRVEADALVIAGDFFDNSRVGDDVVDFAVEQIGRFERPVVLLPGNHDPLDDGRIYHRACLEDRVDNLRLVREQSGDLFEVDGVEAVFWGRGYFDDDWGFRPLEGIPERQDERWHIALGHGHVVRAGQDPLRSLPIQEDEIGGMAGHWDYLALGHWEPHADVSAGGMTAVYSGAPMPLSDANRMAGWAIIVDCDDEAGGVRWQRHRVDPRTIEGGAEG